MNLYRFVVCMCAATGIPFVELCACVCVYECESALKNELRDYRVMLIKSFIFYKGPNKLFNVEFMLLLTVTFQMEA